MTRRIDDDCTLTYTFHQETWYASAYRDEPPTVSVHATADGGGVKWEFQVSVHEWSGGGTKLEIFSDAYEAFADVPEFFDQLRRKGPRTVGQLLKVLDGIGAVDRTERVSPYRQGRS